MVDVFITIDTEIWCDGWNNIDNKFQSAYKRYIYGTTPQGDYGLPIQLKVLGDHGIKGVFFVEPLFSLRFGSQPLVEIVNLIREKNQEIQLHLHPEWIDEAKNPVFNRTIKKTPHLSAFTLEEQSHLIKLGKELLLKAGVDEINGFRAGSYAANKNTLAALEENNILIDTSYNFASEVGVADISADLPLIQPATINGVAIFPVTFFNDGGINKYRHLQLTACSFAEIEFVLNHAYDHDWSTVVIVLHSFELLMRDKSKPNKIVFERFMKLCQFLDRNRDRFHSCGTLDLNSNFSEKQPAVPISNRFRTIKRMIEQKVSNY